MNDHPGPTDTASLTVNSDDPIVTSGVFTPDPPLCLDRGTNQCSGPAEYRESLSGTGTPIPRCDHHWDLRLAEQERINQRYPQQQPSDFDPYYAGESWYEDY